MRRTLIKLTVALAALTAYDLGYYVVGPTLDGAGTVRIAGTPVAEPTDDEPGFDCRRHGNRRCGPIGVAPGGTWPDDSTPAPEFKIERKEQDR